MRCFMTEGKIKPEPSGRFVRELPDEERFEIIEPSIAGRYFTDHVFTPFEEFVQEELWTLMLNVRNYLTHTAMIYRGSINMISVRNAEIFRTAVRINAASIIIGHNHPSGQSKPSSEDVQMTRAVRDAGQILGIELLDHMVIGGKGSWTSLKEERMGF